jgi:hypothetical protein
MCRPQTAYLPCDSRATCERAVLMLRIDSFRCAHGNLRAAGGQPETCITRLWSSRTTKPQVGCCTDGA